MTAGSSRAPITIDQLRSGEWVVVIATVAAAGPSRWTTPGGERPTRNSQQSVDAAIVTPLTLTRLEPVVGELRGRQVDAIGGSIGCDSYVNTDLAIPKVGDRLVLVLSPFADGPLRDALLPVELWRVDEQSGTVMTPGEGDVRLADLIQRVRPGGSPRPS